MAMQFADDLRDDLTGDMVTGLNALLGAAAKIHIFDGIQPALCSDADDGTQLVELQMSTTPFGSATANTFSANGITNGSASAAGTIVYFRMKNSGGDVICQGTCGTGGGNNIVFNTTTVNIADTVAISALDATVFVNGS